MKREELFETLEDINEDYINEARQPIKKSKYQSWAKWGALAACLCLIVSGVLFALPKNDANHLLKWNDKFTAEDYFKFSSESENMTINSIADRALEYSESRFFNYKKDALEEALVIPQMPEHPLFTFQVNYNEDGSIYDAEIHWLRYDFDSIDNYSSLKVVAGYKEIQHVEDCIAIEIDDNGNVLEPYVTVTERDGVRIVTKGMEKQDKVITFENEYGWYQITGSWNDSYESVVELLDWFFEHPIDFNMFPIEEGDNYTGVSLPEMPEAFEDMLPDFESFGFMCEEANVGLKNGVPISFEGHFTSDSIIYWCIEGEPNIYDMEQCIGNLEDLTMEQVLGVKPVDEVTTETKVVFMQGDYVVIVYAKDVNDAWKLIDSLRQ